MRIPALLLTSALAVLVYAAPGEAFNYVSDTNGTWWGIQDVAPPRVDTGSIRATQVGPGQSPAYSTTINGFGGVKVSVPGSPRFNGELMRGYGLTLDGTNHFKTTQAINLGGIEIARDRPDQAGRPGGHGVVRALAGHVHEHDGPADDDPRRVRRPIGLRQQRQQLLARS